MAFIDISQHWAAGPLVDALLQSDALSVVYDVPPRIRERIGPKARVQGFASKDGKITLVAKNLNPTRTNAVLLHEAFHAGAPTLLGDRRWNNLMDQMGRMMKAAERRRAAGEVKDGDFWDSALRRVENARAKDPRLSEDKAREEFAAYAIEHYESAPSGIRKWVDSLIGAIKDFLQRKFGIQLGEVTPAQLRALALAAIRSRIGGNVNTAGQVSQSIDDDVVELYHGGSPGSVVEETGRFGGIFASADKEAAGSHQGKADGLHKIRIPKSQVLSQYELTHDVDYEITKAVFEENLNIESEEDLDLAWEVIAEDKGVWGMNEAEVLRVFRESDLADADWEGQRLRGLIARAAGFKAVEMSDEHGTSYLVLPGVEVRQIELADEAPEGTDPDVLMSIAADSVAVDEALGYDRRNRFEVPPETRGDVLQRIFQDRFNRMKTVQQALSAQNGTLTEAGNVHMAEERYHGRSTARLEDFTDNEVAPFIEAVAEADVTLDEVAEYAYAKHAPERNAYAASINERFEQGNGSGMTDQEAQAVLDEFEANGKTEALDRLHKQLLAIVKGTRPPRGHGGKLDLRGRAGRRHPAA